MRGSNTLDAGVSLASTITTAINQRAEARPVALDIKGAFDSVWWKGLLAYLWSIGFWDKVFRMFESNRYIRVVTPSGSSDLYSVTAGVPQGETWSPPLFSLYIRLLPTVMKHSLIVGYADDHSLLKIIPDKTDQTGFELQFGSIVSFWPNLAHQICPYSLMISLKRDL